MAQISNLSFRSIPIILVLFLSACAHTMGQAKMSDGNILSVYGEGEDVTTQVQCLTPDTITKLTGSSIPGDAPQQACYTVVSISAKSSGISQAITNFVSQSAQLQSETNTDVAVIQASKGGAPGAAPAVPVAPVAAASPAITNAVSAIVSAAVANPSATSAQAAAKSLSNALSSENKDAVAQQLDDLSSQAPNTSLSTKLDQAATQLRE